MIHVCVPTIKRYDLLRNLLYSLEASKPRPDRVFIIDNGQDAVRMKFVRDDTILPTDLFTPATQMGVAESWNWFLREVPEERIICNDDVVFAPHSLQKIVDVDADLVIAMGFSCFLIRDNCVKHTGYFDETISPGYGYYEDEDYHTRIIRDNVVKALSVDADIDHFQGGSQTLKQSTHEELQEHHAKFKKAQDNYMKKWGAMPGVVKQKMYERAKKREQQIKVKA